MEVSITDLLKMESECVEKCNTFLVAMSMFECMQEEAQKNNDMESVSFWSGEIAKEQQKITNTKKTLRYVRKYLSDILKGYEPEWGKE